MSDIQASDTLREWTESAPYWEEYSATIRAMFTPVTAALIEDAGIREGQTVLDVAGGPGEPSLTMTTSKSLNVCAKTVVSVSLMNGAML